MKYLLDTHTFLWSLTNDTRLGADAKKIFTSPRSDLYFSMASYWEICIKISLGKLTLHENWKSIIEKEMEHNQIKWLPIRKAHLEAVVDLPFLHRDPFDRVLIAQAQCEKMTFVTGDESNRQYNIRRQF